MTGPTLNGNESGGTWTNAGELLASPAVPTADWLYSSPRCRPPDFGRQCQPEPDQPLNAVSLTFGFFLPGKPV